MAAIGEFAGVPLFVFIDDFATFFYQFRLASRCLWYSGIVMLDPELRKLWYIVEGVMHEHRIVDPSIEKKRAYVPETVEVNGETHLKYSGPDLHSIDASKEGVFSHYEYHAGEMFINAIGDVHQSYTRGEGVKLLVMWGDGNADVPDGQSPQNSAFLNRHSAKAWDAWLKIIFFEKMSCD